MSICKTCTFRTEDTNDCPFGLPITEACHTAGAAIDHMAPLSDNQSQQDRQEHAKLNRKIFLRHRDMNQCQYAQQLGGQPESVNCVYGESDPKFPPVAFNGSPLYPSIFQGAGGLYSIPSSNVYDFYDSTAYSPFGLFSFQGSAQELLSRKDLFYKLSQLKLPQRIKCKVYSNIAVEGKLIKVKDNFLSPIINIAVDKELLKNSSVIPLLIEKDNVITVFLNDISQIDIQ